MTLSLVLAVITLSAICAYLIVTVSKKEQDRKEVNDMIPMTLSVSSSSRGMEITKASGQMAEQLGNLIGRNPREALPPGVFESLLNAWEDAFGGRSSSCSAVIDGKSYTVAVTPVMKGNGGAVNEVVSVALKTSDEDIKEVWKREFRTTHMTVLVYIEIEGMEMARDALGQNGMDEILHNMKDIVMYNLRPNHKMTIVSEGRMILLLPQIQKREMADLIATDIIDKMCKPMVVDGYSVTMPISHRVMFFPDV